MISKIVPFFDFLDSDIVPIDYYLELQGTKYLLPNQPSNVNVSQNTSHEHLYAIDGTPLKRTSDKVMFNITIDGFSGISKRLHLTSRGEKLGTIKEILEYFEHALFQFRLGQKETKDVLFDFYDLRNGRKYHDVHPVSFNYVQSVDQSRLGYHWSLNLVCYHETNAFPDQVTAFASFLQDITDTINSFTAQATKISRIIDTVSNRVNQPTRQLLTSITQATNAIVGIADSGIGAFQTTRNTLLQAMDTIYGAGIKLLNIATDVKDVYNEDLLGAEKLFKDQFEDAKIDFNELLSEFDTTNEQENETPQIDTQTMALEVQETQYQLEILLGLFGAYLVAPNQTFKSSIQGGSFLDRSDSFALIASATSTEPVITNDETEQSKQRYVLRAGDNLYRIAVQLFNDVNRWHELAQLNGWLDAHTTSSGYPPSAGTSIFIPSDPSLLGISALPNLVGRDSILLGDFELTDNDLTFDIVTGEDNFVQAIEHRIRTVQQELVDDIEYGLSGFIGNPERLSLEVIDQLLKDPRVQQVNEVTVQKEGDLLLLDLNVMPFEGDSVNIIVPIGD